MELISMKYAWTNGLYYEHNCTNIIHARIVYNKFSSSLYVMLLCSKWLPTLILPLLN